MGYTVSKEIEFDAGHRVPNHKSKCRNPHGHRYRLRVTIAGELVTTQGASDEGMLADFGDLKTIMTEKVHDVLDHGFMIHDEDMDMKKAFGYFDPFSEKPDWKVIQLLDVPTAENLARWCWDELFDDVQDMGFELVMVELWETPTSLATYTR